MSNKNKKGYSFDTLDATDKDANPSIEQSIWESEEGEVIKYKYIWQTPEYHKHEFWTGLALLFAMLVGICLIVLISLFLDAAILSNVGAIRESMIFFKDVFQLCFSLYLLVIPIMALCLINEVRIYYSLKKSEEKT